MLARVAGTRLWTLYWSDHDERWQRCDLLQPTPDVLVLLDEVDRDPTGIIWG